MFDSPLEESMPGRVVRFGLGYHGFVEFPTLEGKTNCPGNEVRLTTHGGRILNPFPAGVTFSRGTEESAVLFRDPRAVDTPDDLEDELGRDWRRFAVIQIQGIRAGASSGELAYNFALHTPTQNLLVNISLTSLFVTRTQVLARRSRQSNSPQSFRIAGPSLGNSTLFLDAVPTGARALYCTPGSWLRELTISGDYPNLSPVSADVVGQGQAETITSSESGTAIYDVGNWEFGAFAQGVSEGNYSVIVIDQAETGAPFPQGHIFTLPYSGQRSATRRRVVGGYFDGERIAEVWSEDVDTDVYWRTASWGVTSQIVTDEGAQASSFLSGADHFAASKAINLVEDGTVVSRFELQVVTDGTQDFSWTSGAGVFSGSDNTDESRTDDRSFQVTLDGTNILADFPGEWEIIGGGSYGRFPLEDTSAPAGERIYLDLVVSVYSYSRQLKCLRVAATYRRRVSDVVVETRAAYFYGNACCRGRADNSVFVTGNGGNMYGSADPLTGAIRRNYPYPVTWC